MKVILILLLYSIVSVTTEDELKQSKIPIFIESSLEQEVREFKGKRYPRKMVRQDFIAYLVHKEIIKRDQISSIVFYGTFRSTSFPVYTQDIEEN